MIKKMLMKQDELNIQTNGPDWKQNKNLLWYRASWTEAAEMMGWLSWKWWKHETINLEQIKLELVDIWHFQLSGVLKEINIGLEEVSKIILDDYINVKNDPDSYIKNLPLEELIEDFIGKTLVTQEFELINFYTMCIKVDLNIEELFKLYIGKNILNSFRQDHGYKQGDYKKIWNDKEDNDYMILFIKSMSSEEVEELLYPKLEITYLQLLN